MVILDKIVTLVLFIMRFIILILEKIQIIIIIIIVLEMRKEGEEISGIFLNPFFFGISFNFLIFVSFLRCYCRRKFLKFKFSGLYAKKIGQKIQILMKFPETVEPA